MRDSILRNLVFVLALICVSTSSYAEDSLDYNLVSIQTSVDKEVENDQMQVLLSVEHQAKQANGAASKVNADMQWALDLAKKYKGVRIATKNYTTHPRYNKQTIIAWQASQQLEIKGDKFEAISELVSHLQARLQVKSMGFSPKADTKKVVEDQLIVSAAEAFKRRAQIVTKALGFTSYEIVDLNLSTPGYPAPYARQRVMMADESSHQDIAMNSGTSKVVVSATGRIQLRQ